MANKIVILYSGGLDSLIMKHYAEVNYPNSELKFIYFKHGAESEEQEIKTLPSFVEVRTVDWLNETCRPVAKKSDPYAGAIYIPGRNMVFATLAACQELPDEIWLGTLSDESNYQATDKNLVFLSLLNETLQYVLSPFKKANVRFPFVDEDWTKLDAVSWALENGLTKEDLKNTVSCWHKTGDLPCGRCKQCFKRYLIFSISGISEEYEINPLDSEEGKHLWNEYLNNEPTNSDELTVQNMIKEYMRLSIRTNS